MNEGHTHSTAGANVNRLALVLLLTSSYLVAEVVGYFVTGSLALLADAGHVLIDVVGIALALTAISVARRPATGQQTYGYYRLEILSAAVNALLMVGIGAYILYEAAGRFANPRDLPGLAVVAFAVPGVVVNLISAVVLMEGQKVSLNIKGAFLEVASDFAGSVAVIVAGLVLFLTNFRLIDPLASLFIGLFILPRTWALLSEAIHVLLEGVPRNVQIAHVREHILGVQGVLGLHDLHIWTLTSGMPVMSAHVVVAKETPPQQVLDQLCECLAEHFDIGHCTFQIESEDRSRLEHSGH
jgi:cobalt-zinc-cadmium efflux system protein